ncbi:hypothetical protein BDM02DRAFT_3192830 [Thelephora ganbajun]|uniref:Uncharacterized protein n=1 Tax=Thelephora ganbajun TaxID=370292 RepID=A0ACB6YZD9_THEGA|nr:hypothetical protein BDM02DRAFT_3192830 [Thelephora ganbajun]
MTTRIPPELIFHIISFLRDDKATLSACSTCCSALAAAVKPLLFRILRTRLDPKAADRFECLLESDPGVLSLIKRIDVIIQSYKPEVDQRAIKAILYTHDHSGSHPSSPNLPLPLSLVITRVAGTPNGRSSVIAEAAGTQAAVIRHR